MKMYLKVILIPRLIYQELLNLLISLVVSILLNLLYPGLHKKYLNWKLAITNFLCTECFTPGTPWILNGIYSYFIDAEKQFSTGRVDVFYVEQKVFVEILPLELDPMFLPLRSYLLYTGKYSYLEQLRKDRQRQLTELDTPIAYITLNYSESLDFTEVRQKIHTAYLRS